MPEGQMSRVIGRVRRAALVQSGAAMTDGQLLDSFIVERDEAAFEALVRRHADMVYGAPISPVKPLLHFFQVFSFSPVGCGG
jgi:hypothetical protein